MGWPGFEIKQEPTAISFYYNIRNRRVRNEYHKNPKKKLFSFWILSTPEW